MDSYSKTIDIIDIVLNRTVKNLVMGCEANVIGVSHSSVLLK